MISIKSAYEIQRMREVCAIAAIVLEQMCEKVEAGVTTYDLDHFGKQIIESMGAKSACFNYKVGSKRFPSHTCISVNEEVVHGIGVLKRVLRLGDIVTLDVCVLYNGFVGDNARTVIIEPASDVARSLVNSTEEVLYKAIEKAVSGNHVGDISFEVQNYIESKGFNVVRDFVGHGIGRLMHEEPQIPNFGRKGTGPKLKPGMTLAIEPMVTLGGYDVEYAEDGWTAVTVDRQLSAHFEHTVLITEHFPEILTIRKN